MLLLRIQHRWSLSHTVMLIDWLDSVLRRIGKIFQPCNGGQWCCVWSKRNEFNSYPILSNVDSFQIYLGTNLTDTFLNVIDGSGRGEDFCELVGGHEEGATVSNYDNAPILIGILIKYWYFRCRKLCYQGMHAL